MSSLGHCSSLLDLTVCWDRSCEMRVIWVLFPRKNKQTKKFSDHWKERIFWEADFLESKFSPLVGRSRGPRQEDSGTPESKPKNPGVWSLISTSFRGWNRLLFPGAGTQEPSNPEPAQGRGAHLLL